MMKTIALISLLFCVSVRAQSPYLPIAPTQYQPPTKTDDVLPIAPMRTDDRIEMPEIVFTSIKGDDKWEKFERGDDPNDKRTVLIADKEAKAKGKKVVSKNKSGKKTVAQKGKVDSKGKIAKQSANKRKPASAKNHGKNNKKQSGKAPKKVIKSSNKK